ncbi:hypothetical protein [Paenibacillus sp. RC73]|uniref:hypothetical protein n=1 Tax=Paenibacillus sp. RC73 TaxID=3156250 RepID=UPI0038514918
MAALLDSVRMRTVAASGASSLAEIGSLLRQTTQELADAINAGLTPEFNVRLGA